jgi:hypothetical protein
MLEKAMTKESRVMGGSAVYDLLEQKFRSNVSPPSAVLENSAFAIYC